MSLAVLLAAAEYVERREREMEHGYATTLPMPQSRLNSHIGSSSRLQRSRRAKSKLHSNRTTHNELEKNRRAHLRTCLEKLKDMVPLGPDGTRHTTLGLLTKAKHFIKNLEDHERKSMSQKDTLRREQRYLKRRVEHLETSREFASKRRSVSESSVLSTESSTASTSSICESDEIDILGYGSNQSDSDDHSSIQSSSSDGGVTIFTRRLTLGESSPVNPYQRQAL